MDTDLIRTIAIFLTVISGGVCLGLWLGNKGFLSRKMKVSISKALIRVVNDTTFDCQIDVDIDTKGEDVCLEEVMLSHPFWAVQPDTGDNTYTIGSLVRHPGYCVLDEKEALFSEKMKMLAEQSFGTNGFRLSSGKYRCVSLIERIVMTSSDESDPHIWPLEGWVLTMRTASRKVEIPFVFQVHQSSDGSAFCRNYVRPPQSFVCG